MENSSTKTEIYPILPNKDDADRKKWIYSFFGTYRKILQEQEKNDKINMLEINTTPGMTATSFIPQQVRAAGLDIKDVLSDIVENQF